MKTPIFCLLILLIAAIYPLNANSDEGIQLTQDGNTEYRIILNGASPIEIFAAQELQGYLAQSSGAFLPMAGAGESLLGKRIFLGKSALTKLGLSINESALGLDGFVIKTIGGRIIIAGATPSGTLYGVYTFLEIIGCRWFAPGVNGEVIPQIPTIMIPTLNYTERPKINHRGFRSLFLPTYTSTDWIDWMAKNRLNLLMIDETMYDDLKKIILGELERRGIQVGISFDVSISDEESLSAVSKKLAEFINNNPEVDIIELNGTLDNAENKVLKPELVIKATDIIHENYPEKLIYIRVVTTKTSESNSQGNYVFSFEPTSRCYHHSLGDEECEINAPQRMFLKMLAKSGKISLYEHYMASYEQNSLPFPVLQTISSDLKYLASLGKFDGAVSQCELGNFGTYGLNYYVFARMSWNPQYDLGMIVDDYCEKYYNKASEPMKKFFSILEDSMTKMEHFSYIDPPELIIRLFDESTLKELQDQLDMAKSLTGDVIVFERIRKSQLSLEYTSLLWNTIYDYLKGIECQDAKSKDAKEYYQKTVENGEELVKFLFKNIDECVFIVTESFITDYLELIINDARGRMDSLGQ
jgi:hypothetical protein